jgi:hypothetical protein
MYKRLPVCETLACLSLDLNQGLLIQYSLMVPPGRYLLRRHPPRKDLRLRQKRPLEQEPFTQTCSLSLFFPENSLTHLVHSCPNDEAKAKARRTFKSFYMKENWTPQWSQCLLEMQGLEGICSVSLARRHRQECPQSTFRGLDIVPNKILRRVAWRSFVIPAISQVQSLTSSPGGSPEVDEPLASPGQPW